jgi:hypothetical protein
VVQEEFDLAAAHFKTVEPGGKDPGVVDHQQVVGVQILGQVPERSMPDVPTGPVEHQEAGGVPLRPGVLGHQFRGQEIIVVCEAGVHELPPGINPKGEIKSMENWIFPVNLRVLNPDLLKLEATSQSSISVIIKALIPGYRPTHKP